MIDLVDLCFSVFGFWPLSLASLVVTCTNLKRRCSCVICITNGADSVTNGAFHATIRHKNELIFEFAKRRQKTAETPYKMKSYAFHSQVKRGRNGAGTRPKCGAANVDRNELPGTGWRRPGTGRSRRAFPINEDAASESDQQNDGDYRHSNCYSNGLSQQSKGNICYRYENQEKSDNGGDASRTEFGNYVKQKQCHLFLSSNALSILSISSSVSEEVSLGRLYSSSAHAPKSSSLHRSEQNGRYSLFSYLTGLPHRGHFTTNI
jgi:hypothetical protein